MDIRASAFAYLSLNSTYIPEQRKKNEDDEFNMRRIMQEGDLIVAEVHSVNHDKTYNLHTRNPKYGRLEPGLLVELAPRQVKRQKHHMISLFRLGLILGNNGNVFLSNFRRSEHASPKDEVQLEKYSEEMYCSLSLLGNLLRLVGFEGLEVSELLLKDLYEWAKEKGIEAVAILQEGEVREELLQRVRERIPKRIEEISLSLKKN